MSRPTLHALPTPAEILDAPERAMNLGPAEAAALLPRFAAALESLRVAAWRPPAAEFSPSAAAEPASPEERWLRPEEAAALFGASRRQIVEWSRRTDWRDFTIREGRKFLRIKESGFRRWWDRPKRGTR